MVKSIKIYGEKLARLREERMYSQEEFAHVVGISRGNIARLEGEHIGGMLPSKFRVMAEKLNIPVADLLKMIGHSGGNGIAAATPPPSNYLKKAAKPRGPRGPRPKSG